MARVGIDLDGCAYPFAAEITQYARKKFGVEMPFPTHWNFHQKQWGMSNEQLLELMIEALLSGDLWAKQPPFPGFAKATWELSDAGHTVVIVTDRMQTQEKHIAKGAQAVTRAWLGANRVNYDELHFASDKTQFDCDLFIDDRPQAVPTMRLAGIDAVYMHAPWNEWFPYPRVYSWQEFVTYVKEASSVQAG